MVWVCRFLQACQERPKGCEYYKRRQSNNPFTKVIERFFRDPRVSLCHLGELLICVLSQVHQSPQSGPARVVGCNKPTNSIMHRQNKK